MRKALFITLCLCLTVPSALAQSAPTLKSVKKIYLGDFGHHPESDLAREKMRLRLAKSGRFSVVDKIEEADAILTAVVSVENVNTILIGGGASVSWGQPGYDSVYGPVYGPGYGGRTVGVSVYGGNEITQAGTGVFRLKSSSSQETIWAYEVKPDATASGGATGQVAEKAVKQLLKDVKKADSA